MLTPAVQAYGLPVVIVILLLIVASAVMVAVDFVLWSRRQDRAAARRRHPSTVARHRRPVPRPLDADLPAAPLIRRPPRHAR